MVMPMVTEVSKTISASAVKAQCLALMDEVAKTGEAIVITKNGKPAGLRI
jgi:prevent-host-death family protein